MAKSTVAPEVLSAREVARATELVDRIVVTLVTRRDPITRGNPPQTDHSTRMIIPGIPSADVLHDWQLQLRRLLRLPETLAVSQPHPPMSAGTRAIMEALQKVEGRGWTDSVAQGVRSEVSPQMTTWPYPETTPDFHAQRLASDVLNQMGTPSANPSLRRMNRDSRRAAAILKRYGISQPFRDRDLADGSAVLRYHGAALVRSLAALEDSIREVSAPGFLVEALVDAELAGLRIVGPKRRTELERSPRVAIEPAARMHYVPEEMRIEMLKSMLGVEAPALGHQL